MGDNTIELSRRKLLAGIGAVGATGAGAGLGTSALFSDEEQFGNNRVVAGELDMRVAWESYYSNQASSSVPFQREGGSLSDPTRAALPANATDATSISVVNESRARTFLKDIQVDSFPSGYDPSNPPDNPCPNGLGDADNSPPAIDLTDVKPGDFGSVAFDFALCDNPGFVWLRGQLTAAEENGRTEPESAAAAETDGVVELLDAVQAAIWVDDGDAIQGSASLVASGTLRQVLNALTAGEGLGLPGDASAGQFGGQGRNCFSTNTAHSVVLAWRVPVAVGNEIQSDRVTFDVGLYTEQCRNNSASSTEGNLLPQSKLFPGAGSTDDEYGRAVDVDGNTAVVGAPNGSVYVLERDGGTWVHTTTLETDAEDDVGVSVAVDGDIGLFSAPSADEAYIYTRSDGGWVETTTLGPSNNPRTFGYEAVALDADSGVAVVSGYDAAYVYERSESGWPSRESTRLATGDDLPADGLALASDTLLIGAPAVDGMRAGGPGKVHVYSRDGAGPWSESTTLGSEGFENFGSAVALDGNTAVVGASVAGGSGAAYVYEQSSATWNRTATLTPSNGDDGDEFGHTVAIRDGRALVGAPDADGSTAGSGAAYVFDGSDGWSGSESQRLVSTDGETGDEFGSGLALSASVGTVFVGARESDGAKDDSGAVYVFDSEKIDRST